MTDYNAKAEVLRRLRRMERDLVGIKSAASGAVRDWLAGQITELQSIIRALEGL